MDHQHRYGAVMALKNCLPISVARSVMEKCVHNVLVGDGALKWALDNGFVENPDILTPEMKLAWSKWRESKKVEVGHDTIGLVCLDSEGRCGL